MSGTGFDRNVSFRVGGVKFNIRMTAVVMKTSTVPVEQCSELGI